MSEPTASVLELPAMFHGPISAVRSKMRSQGKRWAQDYLKTGTFNPPRSMLPVSSGELLEMQSNMLLDDLLQDCWRIHMFDCVFLPLRERLPKEERRQAIELLELFCLNMPWGALFHAVSPYPPWSAANTSRRLAALLRFWDVLQGPRYAFWYKRVDTLEEMMEDIYGKTLEAWCPGNSAPMRERMTLCVARMSQATREECTEVLLRIIPPLVALYPHFKHHALLNSSEFLQEQLTNLSLDDFESISGACKHAVGMQLAVWDRALGR